MPTYSTQAIRNIAFVGQHGSGKTTLVEALLHKAGVIGAMGSIENRDTTADYMEEEKEHGHSLADAIVHCDYKDTHINLIDTPGAADFLGQTITALAAIETAALVIDASAGIDAVSRRIMQEAKDLNLCRMIIVNKIDSNSADFAAMLQRLQDAFGTECLPVNLPADGGKRVVDCFFNPDGQSDLGSVADAHSALIDQVVEVDEELMALYLEQGEELQPEQLHEPFEKALREGHLVPVCFTAARPHDTPDKPVGISELLDIFVKLAPNPTEGNPRPFVRGDDNSNQIHPRPDADAHVLAHVFNVRVDPFVGKLSMFRVHQGTITRDTQLYIGDPRNGDSKRPFKVGHLFKLQGKDHVEVERAVPGDIVAVAKVEEVHRDAVLHDHHDEDRIHLAPMPLPEPMQGLAITPKRRGDEQKIADALSKLVEEDPSFRVTRDPATKETVIQGLGDLHLRVVLEKLKTRYNVEVDTKPPKIAYRETITAKAEGHHRHKKQTGGAGQFGEVFLRVEPLDRGAGFEYSNDVFGGAIPNSFIPAIEKGVRQAMEEGALGGYPVQDVKVSVYDGKHHPVDSKEVAFVTAGKRAFIDAFNKAKPVLLEPMVNLEVTVPQNAMGDITGDLSGRRGRIVGTDIEGDQAMIKALVPMAEITTYQSQLKSITGGQGSYTMQFSHYDPVPGNVQQQIVAQYQPREEED
ncbi:elongation factor G [Phycisphaerales bacterium AB-hyl4]|uniref:Elongation factor G n=1 Tax=Natronomicrosphaera hydrolytica TaxID=3242702 RepID=A0ABV4U187_9BACT